jgi:hypothetical protein
MVHTPKPPKKSNATSSKSSKRKNPSKSSLGVTFTHSASPTSWPTDLPFLTSPYFDRSLTPTQLEALRPKSLTTSEQTSLPKSSRIFLPQAHNLVKIEKITSTSHPAFGQSGLFANRNLSPGTHLIDYLGKVHACPSDECKSSDYDLCILDRSIGVGIDSAGMGNEARFINDFRGIREKPNAEFREHWIKIVDRGVDKWEIRMGVWVLEHGNGIGKGEEVCVSYGKGYWKARGMFGGGESGGSIEVGNATIKDEDETGNEAEMKT